MIGRPSYTMVRGEVFLAGTRSVSMCDTWIAMPNATETRRVIFAKNSDRPAFDCQPLTLQPAQRWPTQSTLQLEYVQIAQAEHTYAHLGSRPYWCWGYEEGLNEHGV